VELFDESGDEYMAVNPLSLLQAKIIDSEKMLIIILDI
jgi:hypothetical protein